MPRINLLHINTNQYPKNMLFINAVNFGQKLTTKLNTQNDICLVLSVNNRVVMEKIFHHNDLTSHIRFMNETMDYLYMDNAIITMYALCNNKDDFKKKFSIYWFFEYMLTATEILCSLEMCVIHDNVVTSLNAENAEFSNIELNNMLNKIKNSKYTMNTNELSKSIYNQDRSSFRWIDSL